jgi:hypothetical protein
MHRVTITALVVFSLASACAPADVRVEVLPPRTSVTCAAPDRSAAALGRGLLDVTASLGTHGAYVSDLRLTVKGQDAHVDGVSVAYTIPDGADTAVGSTAEDAAGDVVVGDTVLLGADDDVRTALIENVQLVPRALAVALQEDTGLELSQTEFATITVDVTPVVSGDGVVAATTTFALDVCKGCLVQPPEVCADEGQFALLPVTCRPGQDTPLFTCVSTGAP